MRKFFTIFSVLLLVAACSSSDSDGANGSDVSPQGDVGPVSDAASEQDVESYADATGEEMVDPQVIDELRQRLDEMGIEPLDEPPAQNEVEVELGHNLFFDPILSGAMDTNCAFCHAMDESTTDAFPLSAGTGSFIDEHGDRRPAPELEFTPRNSFELFNRGHDELSNMFWDARVEQLESGKVVLYDRSIPRVETGYLRVAPEETEGLLGAVPLFPVHSRREMRGVAGTENIFGEPNELAGVSSHHFEATWDRLMDRIGGVEDYVEMLEEVHPEKEFEDLHYAHAANAIAAFLIDAFTFPDSPWDEFLEGDDEALTPSQIRGADLFYGEANCSNCHGGQMFTDQKIHNFAVPPMTAGKESLYPMDFGAAHLSHAGMDQKFHFRTPPLRNVELTAPYMHNGAYETLEDVIRHKVDPVHGLWNFDHSHMGPAFQSQVHTGEEQLAQVEETISEEIYMVPELSDDEIDDLVAFMHALTSPDARELEHLDLQEVPSGLPVPDPKDPPAIFHQ